LPIPRLLWLTFHREVDTGSHYHRWTVPKRDGGLRPISAPKPQLKAAQRWIARQVTEHLPVHGAAHGFLPGRSIATNARVHAGAKIVVKLDIEGFYPTVTYRRVKGLLRQAGLGEQVAILMALLATEAPREELVLRGKTCFVAAGPPALPQGAPTRPHITHAPCLRPDFRPPTPGPPPQVGRHPPYAATRPSAWTADPAGAADRSSGIGKLLPGLTMIVADEGFTIKRTKTRVMRAGGRQKVTGLVVNEAAGRPPARVPRVTQRQLRAAIKNRELGRPGRGESLEALRGMAAYVMMTDPVRGRAFMERIDRLARTSSAGEPPAGSESP